MCVDRGLLRKTGSPFAARVCDVRTGKGCLVTQMIRDTTQHARVLRIFSSCEASVAANFGVLGKQNPMKVVGSRNDPMKLSIIRIYACLQNNTSQEPITTFSPSSCLIVSSSQGLLREHREGAALA